MKAIIVLVLALASSLAAAPAAAGTTGQGFDTPNIQVYAWTADPRYHPAGLPGLVPCGPCAWGVFGFADTSDKTAQAFVVSFTYKTTDGTSHEATVTVPLYDSNGQRAGGGFVHLGFDRVEVTAITRWMRVNQIAAGN